MKKCRSPAPGRWALRCAFAMTLLKACLGVATAQGPTPLLPHPPERLHQKPVYSQDRYKRNAPVEVDPDNEMPKYTQDQYARPPSKPETYTDQLRKVPSKGREWSEIEIAKGIVALNAGRYADAVKRFETALKHDPRNFVALEYMSAISERQGDLHGAIAKLAKAKRLAPKGRYGQLNFQIGRLYLTQNNYERAELYLRLALDGGGQATAVNYTLGYLMYLQERFFEAEHYLHEARMRASRRTALVPEREMLQAINYYLGEIYARLGFTQYSVIMLRGTEVGDSWEVRQAAWRVHSELNHFNWYATLGAFGQYDSNVVLVPVGGSLPTEFSTQEGISTVLTANAGIQTSPAKKWSFGTDGSIYLNYHLNTSLQGFDVLNYGIDGWVNYWNQKDWSFVGRYDYSNVLTDRANFTSFQTTHGPLVSANYFPFQRWNWEAGFQLRANSFATDEILSPDQRSGSTYAAFLRASLRSPNPRLRPVFGYTFEADQTEGVNFQSRNHIILAELDWRLFSKTHLVAGITLTKAFYPNHLQGRRDTIQQVRLGVNHLFSAHWVGMFDLTQLEDNSTLSGFSYKRTVATGGLTYTF